MSLLRLAAFAIVLQIVVADTAVDKLYRSKKDYIRHVEPGNVTLQIGISYVCGTYNRHNHILTSRVFERYSWRDTRLAWNPKDYSGLTQIIIPADKIWIPEVKLYNAFEHSEDVDYTDALLLSNGTVIWVPRVTYTTLCDEHDQKDDHVHHCKLKLGSWVHSSVDMPLELFEGGFDTAMYLKECRYVVSHYRARILNKKYDCCADPYPFLHVDLDIERRHHEEEEHEEAPEKKNRWEKHLSTKPCFWPHC
jgi:hypothetical protein